MLIFSYHKIYAPRRHPIMLTTKEKMTTEALAGAFLLFFLSLFLCDVLFHTQHTNIRFYAPVRKFVFVERFEFGLHQTYARLARKE